MTDDAVEYFFVPRIFVAIMPFRFRGESGGRKYSIVANHCRNFFHHFTTFRSGEDRIPVTNRIRRADLIEIFHKFTSQLSVTVQ